MTRSSAPRPYIWWQRCAFSFATHVAESELRLAALHSGARLLARGTWIMEHRFLFGCLHPAVACAMFPSVFFQRAKSEEKRSFTRFR